MSPFESMMMTLYYVFSILRLCGDYTSEQETTNYYYIIQHEKCGVEKKNTQREGRERIAGSIQPVPGSTSVIPRDVGALSIGGSQRDSGRW